MEIRSFDRVAHCYDATRALPAPASAAVTAGLVQTFGRAAATAPVLEVGVGTGRIAVPLAAAGVHIVGIDVAAGMLAHLRSKRPDLPVVRAESTRLPFRARTFSAALFVHVLHLVPHVQATLRAARDVVHPGGLVVHGTSDYGRLGWAGAYAAMREELETLGQQPPPADGAHDAARSAFAAFADEVGSPIEETVLARWTERRTRRELLDGVAGRLYSNTWSIPDAVMPELARRLERRLSALPGGLDAEIESAASFGIACVRLP